MQSIKVQQQELIMMNSSIESPVTVSAEQATVHATAMESINIGIEPQANSNCIVQEQQQVEQFANSVQIEGEAFNTKIFTQLKNGIKVNYFDCFRAGIKFAYLEKNRSIDENHVLNFVESFKRVGVLNSIKVVAARKMIEEGCIVRDRAGNILSSATPNINLYYCILDGQHKADALALWIANAETKDIPLDASIEAVNIPEGISAGAYIAEYNLTCKKWNHRDTQALLVQAYEKEGRTVLSRIGTCVDEDNMTQRGAWKIYKMNDGYKKSKYEDALFNNKLSDELRGTDAEIERGDRIRRAIQVACRKVVKMKRNSAIIDAIIAEYNAVSDTQKAEIMNLLMLFITSLSEQVLTDAMKEGAVSKKTEAITRAWKDFHKEIKKDGKKEEYEALALSAEEAYDKAISSAKSSKKSSNLDKIKKILS